MLNDHQECRGIEVGGHEYPPAPTYVIWLVGVGTVSLLHPFTSLCLFQTFNACIWMFCIVSLSIKYYLKLENTWHYYFSYWHLTFSTFRTQRTGTQAVWLLLNCSGIVFIRTFDVRLLVYNHLGNRSGTLPIFYCWEN